MDERKRNQLLDTMRRNASAAAAQAQREAVAISQDMEECATVTRRAIVVAADTGFEVAVVKLYAGGYAWATDMGMNTLGHNVTVMCTVKPGQRSTDSVRVGEGWRLVGDVYVGKDGQHWAWSNVLGLWVAYTVVS